MDDNWHILLRMRLSPHAQATICQTVAACLPEVERILLFGSRLDDQRRGGDIDLLITSKQVIPDRLAQELKIAAQLQRKLDGRQVDVLLIDPSIRLEAIHHRALETGVSL